MGVRSYSDEGFVLARKNYSEADRILSVFSKNHGKISLLAKGVRKTLSKKRGHIEVFSRIKFSLTKTKGLPVMTEAEVVDSYSKIRKNLKKVALAYYFLEVVGKTTREEEKHRELYEILVKIFEALKKEGRLKKLKEAFVYEVLTSLGFWPKGKVLVDPDSKLAEVTERNLTSVRVGKRLLS